MGTFRESRNRSPDRPGAFARRGGFFSYFLDAGRAISIPCKPPREETLEKCIRSMRSGRK